MDHKDTCSITRARSKGNIVDNVFGRLEGKRRQLKVKYDEKVGSGGSQGFGV